MNSTSMQSLIQVIRENCSPLFSQILGKEMQWHDAKVGLYETDSILL